MSLSADIVAVLCLLTLSLLSYERERDGQGWRGNGQDCFNGVCVCVAAAGRRAGRGGGGGAGEETLAGLLGSRCGERDMDLSTSLERVTRGANCVGERGLDRLKSFSTRTVCE